MAKTTTINGQIVKQYLRKFPDTPSLTLAKKIYKENKKSFNSVDSIRSIVRFYREKSGNKHRDKIRDKEFINQKPKYNLPESYANNFTPFRIQQERVLIISDLHFPYQNNNSIELALDYGKSKKVDCILINGDLIDFAGISRHEKDWRQRSVNEEFESVRLFLKTLREHFPKTRIIYKHGNHDERWEKWLFLKAPEVFDVPDFQLEVLLRLGELHIETVKDKRPVTLGKLTVLHGHELAGGSGGVNPARSTFLKTLDNVLVGHFHKTSSNTETTLSGNMISTHSQGCLCDLFPHYMPINRHNLGFSYVEVNIKTNEYYLNNLKIIKGKIY